jgi:hypothetical protein
MKKLLLFILFSGFAFGQDISPYYPAKQLEALQGNEPTQLTYYDSQYTTNCLISFLTYRMGMSQLEPQKGKTDSETIYPFQDKFSDGKIYVTLNEAKINTDALYPVIVTSLKINGTKDRVFSFFINYWNTTIDWDAKKSDIERKHFQDVIRLHFNNGKPYITITNASYKNTKEFEAFFNDLKSKEGKPNASL